MTDPSSSAPIITAEYQTVLTALTEVEAAYLHTHAASTVELTLLHGTTYQLRTRQWVGALRLPSGRALYIQPKVPIANLLHLIAVTVDLDSVDRQTRWPPVPQTWSTDTSTVDLLHWLVRQFVEATSALARQGWQRGYRPQQERAALIRGKLDLAETLRRPASPLHVSQADQLSTDVPHNQALKLALQQAMALTAPTAPAAGQELADAQLYRQAIQLNQALAEVSLPPRWPTLHIDRLTAPYHTALALGQALVEGRLPSSGVGSLPLAGYMVDMQRLFERYVIRRWTAALPNDWRLVAQPNLTLDVEQTLTARPDAVLYADGEARLVMDAKYKRTRDPADVYQILAYCQHVGVTRAVLVYPAADGITPSTHHLLSPTAPVELTIQALDLAAPPAQLDRQVSAAAQAAC